ncbi:MAG TPA: class III signal peptide-containing protein [archaeon]|nr:class III signal peptide-containing protein [archaeon]
MDSKAQISIELIIVLAAVIAIVLIFVGQLQNTSKEGLSELDSTADSIFEKIKEIRE